jgi:hypothetical protein
MATTAGTSDNSELLDGWAAGAGGLDLYAAGGTGPAAADQLLARDRVQWLPLARPIR